MSKHFFIILIFTLLFHTGFCQGLIFDSAQFASRTSVTITRGALPKSISFKKYTPIPYPQVGATCVAQTFAAARTILAAKSLGLTDKKKITELSFSPYYIYYRNKMDGDVNCTYGLMVDDAAEDVLKNGFAPLVDVEYPGYYPFTKQALCIEKSGTSYPPSMEEDEEAASKYKIDEVNTVRTLQQLKTALAKGMPVVVILFPPNSFTKLKTDLWTSLISEKLNTNIMAHAVLAVGYNDTKYGGCIEIMNSWGDEWGNKSFASIKYKDYAKFFIGGYAFFKKDEKIPLTNTAIVKNISKTRGASITPVNIDVKRGYGNNHILFNNAEILKSFKK